MCKTSRSFCKVAAVLSALILTGGYVASRASPSLFRSLQVFGGEGGGRAIPTKPAGNPDSAILPSGKSASLSGYQIKEFQHRSSQAADSKTRTQSSDPEFQGSEQQYIVHGTKSAPIELPSQSQ